MREAGIKSVIGPVSNYDKVRKETALFLPVPVLLYALMIPVKLFLYDQMLSGKPLTASCRFYQALNPGNDLTC